MLARRLGVQPCRDMQPASGSDGSGSCARSSMCKTQVGLCPLQGCEGQLSVTFPAGPVDTWPL